MSRRQQPKTIALDFDGVIHAYTKGWQGGDIYDTPTPDCREALHALSKHFRIVVHTCRHDLPAVERWLVQHRLFHYVSDVTNRKPPAVLYVDDRGLRFTGDWRAVLNAAAQLERPPA